MNNYQKKARTDMLVDITIKCKDCFDSSTMPYEITMVPVIDLWDETIIGYSCPNCPNYFLYSVTTDTV